MRDGVISGDGRTEGFELPGHVADDKEITMPRRKKAVGGTAVVTSELALFAGSYRHGAVRDEGSTHGAARMIFAPADAMPTTMPGKTPWTIVSALNSARRRLTSVESHASASTPRTMRAQRVKGEAVLTDRNRLVGDP